MLSIDDLFRRNFQYARSINYDLSKVHSDDVCKMIRTSADSLLLDEQMLSLTLRTTAAFHLDTAKIRIDNDENREKHVVDYTLIITTIGTGKSTIFSKLSQAVTKREEFEKQRKLPSTVDKLLDDAFDEEKRRKKKIGETQKGQFSRHMITNDFTGAGIFKSLSDTGNVFILIDEFDGEYQKSNIFSTDSKAGSNSLASANSLLKTMHTGVDSYRKTRADGHVLLSKPHITFLAASNGSVVIEILRQKLKTANVADAMVERFQWEALMACTKLNSTRLVNIPPNSVGLELYFIASSLLTNHTFIFAQEANEKMCSWMDELALARARWDQIDTWFSGRLAKSIDQTARVAAELSHIELTMDLLNQFINTHDFNTFGIISLETYCQLVDFIQNLYPPGNNTIIEISEKTVESAIYCMSISMIKYLNLFNIDSTCTTAILELPMHPPHKLETDTNPSIANLPTTQQLTKPIIAIAPKNEFQELQKLIMLFPSIIFTRTILYSVSKLKAKKGLLDDLLKSLVEIGLLKQFNNGIITGMRRSNLYIKSLPTTETLNTTNQFTLDLLDKINLPWLLYRPTCVKLLLPSKSSIVSPEATEYLQVGIYPNIISQHGVAKKSSQSSSVSAPLANMNNISSMTQSTHSDEITSPDTLLNTSLQTDRIVNANMPQPPPSTAKVMSSLAIHSHINQNIDLFDESEDDSIKDQQQSQYGNDITINTKDITDENDYPGNSLKSTRQSDRIKRSKRPNATAPISSSVRKKRKK